MDDSDDYFGVDDIEFNDELFAAVDNAQTSYLISQSQVPKPSPAVARHTPPPAKRQKTHHQWKPAIQRTESVDDSEDLPEISVQGDGSYGVAGPSRLPSRNTSFMAVQNVTTAAPSIRSRTPTHLGHTALASVSRRPQPQNVRRFSDGNTVTQRVHTPPPGLVSNSSVTSRQPAPLQSQSSLRPPNSQAFPCASQDRAEHTLRTELSILRAQVEELGKVQEENQKALQEARDAQLAKAGEVSILRSGIEKTVHQHAAEMAKLKAAKESAEAMQAQIQRNMKEEMERLKTQFTFKQHELETGVRKTPWTARAKKINRQAPSSPVVMPTQIRQWNNATGSNALMRTPRRPPRLDVSETPEILQYRKPGPASSQVRAENPKKTAMLPGFHNAFQPSSPAKVKGKGKERESGKDSSVFFAPGAHPSSPPSSPIRAPARRAQAQIMDPADVPMEDGIPLGGFEDDVFQQQEGGMDEDVEMGDPRKDDLFTSEEYAEVEPIDWREELHHIIFTHSLSPPSLPPGVRQLTFQLLLPSPSNIPPEHSHIYSSASAKLLETLGTSSRFVEWDTQLQTISDSFVNMAHVLTRVSSFSTLTTLLNLLRILCYSIPSFTSSLISSRSPNDDDDAPSRILTILCDIITDHLVPKKEGGDEEKEVIASLANETLGLLETLSWSIPDALVPSLSIVPRTHNVLMTLISPLQPIKLLQHSSRALALLASHHSLFRHFLAFPPSAEQALEQDGQIRPPDYGSLPQIEQLAFYLVDSHHEGPDLTELRASILAFFATLAISHPDALMILQKSHSLIPSIIHFLTQITTPFWEEDEEVVSSPARITSLIHLMNRTVSLLYYMICCPTGSSSPTRYDLTWQLYHPYHKHFNGVSHMFIVTFGRLSFADPPDWLSDVDKVFLEQTADLARELLELVVEGPELDLVWEAFQPDPDVNKRAMEDEEDDEEREARLLHPIES